MPCTDRLTEQHTKELQNAYLEYNERDHIVIIEIKHRWNESVLFSHDVEDNTVQKTLIAATKQGADLQGAYLQGAYLQGADLQGAYLQGADLQGAYLQGAYLQGADLQGADLQGADLQGADLQGAYLRGAYLQGADLQGADLQGAYLQGADLQGAYLRGKDEDVLEKTPLYINELYWIVTITTKHLTIGCQHHSHEAWTSFTDEEIADMDSHAQEFWKVWKTPLLAMCAAHKL